MYWIADRDCLHAAHGLSALAGVGLFGKQYLSQFLFVKDRPTRNQALSRETGKANTPKCLVHEERILNMT